MTASAAARTWTSSLADTEVAPPPTPPAESPTHLLSRRRRHTPSYERMMASTREAPPTPVSSRSHRAGGRGPSVALEARQAMGGDDAAPPTLPAESPARRHTPSYEHMMDSTRSSRARSRAESRDPGAVLAARYKRVWADPVRCLPRYKSAWGGARSDLAQSECKQWSDE